MKPDELFGLPDSEIEIRKMDKGEFIAKARSFINDVANMYWTNWEQKMATDEERDENKCDNCEGHCVITIGENLCDCYPDHEYGECFIRVFNDANYAAEMGELIEKMDYMELIDTELELTDHSEPCQRSE